MTVSTISEVMNEKEKKKENASSSTPIQPRTSILAHLSSLVWLPRPYDRPAPLIEVTICAPSTISLTPPAELSIQLTYVLRHPVMPMTMLPEDTILKSQTHPTILHHSLELINQDNDQKYGRTIIDECRIIDHRDSQLSYTNEHNFLTLYPGVPHEVTQVARFWADDPQPLQADSTYRVGYAAPPAIRLWWMYGRKWQVLRWRNWPGGHMKYADYTIDRMGDPPKPGPVQLDIRVVKTCSIRVEA